MSHRFWLFLCILYGIGLSALGIYFDLPIEVKMAAFFAGILVVVIGSFIGGLAGWYLARDADVDTTGFKVIAWFGLIAWVIPILGGTIATMSYMFKRQSTLNVSLYNNLGNIVGLLAFTSAFIGGGWEAYAALGTKQVDMSQSAINARLQRRGINPDELTGERSIERCQYAALESWSREDLDRFCRGR